MNEILRPTNADLRIQRTLYDGANLVSGATVPFSIRRMSDGKYWDGSDWTSTTYGTVNGTDANGVASNDHNRGRYYVDIPAAKLVAADVLEWRSVYTSGGLDNVDEGQIRLDAELHAIKARTCNGTLFHLDTQTLEVLDDDGVTVIRTLGPATLNGDGTLRTVPAS